MVIYGVSLETLTDAANSIGAFLMTQRGGPGAIPVTSRKHGAGFRVNLRPQKDSDTYRVFGYRGRRVHAINYRGHGVFMSHVFGENVGARIETSTAVYDGFASFYAQTGGRFI